MDSKPIFCFTLPPDVVVPRLNWANDDPTCEETEESEFVLPGDSSIVITTQTGENGEQYIVTTTYPQPHEEEAIEEITTVTVEGPLDSHQMESVPKAKKSPVKRKRLSKKARAALAAAGPDLNGKPSSVTQYEHLFDRIERQLDCEYCDTKFDSKAGLLVHHPCYFAKRGLDLKKGNFDRGRKGVYACEFPGCDKAYDLMYTLRRHLVFHFDEFMFACTLCSHQTKAKSDMVKHVRVHVNGGSTAKSKAKK